jgi:hypothetical protein
VKPSLPDCTCPDGHTPDDLRARAACPLTSAADADDLLHTAASIERMQAGAGA